MKSQQNAVIILDQIPEQNTLKMKGNILLNILKNLQKYFSFSIDSYVIGNQYVKKRGDTAGLTAGSSGATLRGVLNPDTYVNGRQLDFYISILHLFVSN